MIDINETESKYLVMAFIPSKCEVCVGVAVYCTWTVHSNYPSHGVGVKYPTMRIFIHNKLNKVNACTCNSL